MSRRGFLVLISLLIALFLFAACNNDNENPSSGGNGKVTNGEEVVITIGNLTDQTGVAAEGMAPIQMALNDIVGYYNDNNLIPGVRLKLISYDDQYDPARDIPGYQKLKRDGADLIWTSCPPAIPVLKPRLDMDKFVMFSATANMPLDELSGGYVFSLGINAENEAYTLLKWIAENDKDFPTDRPAKIGAAAWNDGYNNMLFEAAEAYVKAHPDKFEWDTSYLTEMKFNWTVEAEELKDCDYVFVPTPPHVFMREFRNAGGTAKFLGTEVPCAFLREIGDMGLWERIDGMLFLKSSRWYNETGEIIDISNQLLGENHSVDEAARIRRQGTGYNATKQAYLMCDIIREAVEQVGAENFDSDALFDAATNWEFSLDGLPDFNNFSPTKRISQNYYAVYEARASEESIFRLHDDWLPQVTSPEQ